MLRKLAKTGHGLDATRYRDLSVNYLTKVMTPLKTNGILKTFHYIFETYSLLLSLQCNLNVCVNNF